VTVRDLEPELDAFEEGGRTAVSGAKAMIGNYAI